MNVPALDAHAIYITPTGRRCRIEATGGNEHNWTLRASFVYVDSFASLGDLDGFTLTTANYHMLRREVVLQSFKPKKGRVAASHD